MKNTSRTDPSPVYVSTACLNEEENVDARIELYRNHGLYAIELGGRVCVPPNWGPNTDTPNCRFLIHNYFPPPKTPFVLNLASANQEIRQRSLNFVYRAIDLAARIGSPYYSIHAGFVTDPHGHDGSSFIFPAPNNPQEKYQALERFILTLEMAIDYASQKHVGVLVENNVCPASLRGKLLLQNPEEFSDLFDVFANGQLGILLDTGHLNVSACTLGFRRSSFIERWADHIRVLHLHDNNGASDDHLPLTRNSWILEILRDSRLTNCHLVVESVFPHIAQLRDHVEWLTCEVGGHARQ